VIDTESTGIAVYFDLIIDVINPQTQNQPTGMGGYRYPHRRRRLQASGTGNRFPINILGVSRLTIA